MNVEIQKHTLRLDEEFEFTFNREVIHYIVGYSGFKLQFSSSDHHVRHISIDVRSSTKNGKKVKVKPNLVLHDHHSTHQTSRDSKIDIVIIAIIGRDNPNLIFQPFANDIKLMSDNDFTFVNTALSCSDVEYDIDEDHHLQKFLSYVYPVTNDRFIEIKAGTSIIDHDLNFRRGITTGSLIYYDGNDKDILCAEFNSRKINQKGIISFGLAPENFNPNDYDVGSFISGFALSFDKPNDHHVSFFEISCSYQFLYLNNGEINTKVDLKSYITDKNNHQFDIPHNEISGFLIAINKNAK